MPSDFEKESRALLEAVHGRPVNYSDISTNLTYTKGETPSANHKMGSNPAWWLDCQRRGDAATVAKGLDWCEWYAEQPLHENESSTCNSAYRTRIDGGTYALAMFAAFANRDSLTEALLKKTRLSVGLCLLQSFTGPARKAGNVNPQPANIPVLIRATGPLNPLPGNHDGTVPYVTCSGMRSHVRDGAGHNGPFTGLDDHHLGVLLAQALSLPYSKNYAAGQADLFDTIRSRSSLPPWGLSVNDVHDGLMLLADKRVAERARIIHQWLLASPLPRLPYTIVQRESGSIEAVQRRSINSSTGARQCEVVLRDGTRLIGSADDGMRGGANSSQHIQPQVAEEMDGSWRCSWISNPNRYVEVPRETGPISWRVDILDGQSSFSSDSGVDPVPPDPVNPTPNGPLVYLGRTSVPGEHLYGSRSSSTTVREIHGDAASGYPKRWIAE